MSEPHPDDLLAMIDRAIVAHLERGSVPNCIALSGQSIGSFFAMVDRKIAQGQLPPAARTWIAEGSARYCGLTIRYMPDVLVYFDPEQPVCVTNTSDKPWLGVPKK